MSRPPVFPFTAVVGQEEMKLALRIVATNPAVGGLLIRGERGTAKSTAVRALAALLPEIPVADGCPYNCDPAAPFSGCPHCRPDERVTHRPVPFVELPVGATEDRVLGALDIRRALQQSDYRFEPGLVARAHRGILYVDEVNLLPDHLVDVLLDAAAMGWNTVEREGISFSHPAQFLLVGTMNPEEGELRPQFLDRFALTVDVGSLHDAAERAEAVSRFITFEADPVGFAARWQEQEAAERRSITTAAALLPRVQMPPEAVTAITTACAEAGVEGLRADIVAYKGALTLAALAGRTRVAGPDIESALRLALAHRRREEPGRSTPPPRPATPPPPPPPSSAPPCTPSGAHREPSAQQQGANNGSGGGEEDEGDGPSPAPVWHPPVGPALLLPPEVRRRDQARPAMGGRSRRLTRSAGARGHAAGDVLPRGPVTAVAIAATLRAALARPRRPGGLHVTPGDLRQRLYAAPLRRLVLFLVDASGSMGARGRMTAAKGAAVTLLARAYRQRDRVALITCRGTGAELVLPPTRSVRLAARRLRDVPTGGRTPLAAGLHLAGQTLARHARRAAQDTALVVFLTDGRANAGGADPVAAALAAAHHLRGTDARFLILDSETGYPRLGLARRLATALDGRYERLDQLTAGGVLAAVRTLLLGEERV